MSAEAIRTEDTADIRASLSGDGEAYARLIRRHQDVIAGWLWRFTRERSVLEELVQEVFVQGYLDLGKYRNTGPFVNWLRRIATRTGYRHWKEMDRRRREASIGEHEVHLVAPGGVDDSVDRDELERILSGLSPRDRLVLTLLYLQELSVAEAAEATGWTPTMVKVQAHRARIRLRKMLESEARYD